MMLLLMSLLISDNAHVVVMLCLMLLICDFGFVFFFTIVIEHDILF